MYWEGALLLRAPPPSQFLQFSAKILLNNRLVLPRLGNTGSTIGAVLDLMCGVLLSPDCRFETSITVHWNVLTVVIQRRHFRALFKNEIIIKIRQ